METIYSIEENELIPLVEKVRKVILPKMKMYHKGTDKLHDEENEFWQKQNKSQDFQKKIYGILKREENREILQNPYEEEDNGKTFTVGTAEHWISNNYIQQLKNTYRADFSHIKWNPKIYEKLRTFRQNREKLNKDINDFIEFTMESHGINKILRLIWGNNDECYEYDKKKLIKSFFCDAYAEELGIKDDDDTISQFTFDYTEEKVLELVRKEVSWRKANIKRNINIYKRRQENKLLEVIGKEFNLDVSSISEIVKKVKGAVLYYKGKLFEKQYSKYLEKSKRFDKIELLGASGQPDIVAHKLEENAIYVFSLKNLSIKKHPYYISNDLLKVEYKYAYENSFIYKKVSLFLVVFNNLDNSVVEIELDFHSPTPIIL